MPLNSMTGFARDEGSHAGLSWHWEVRSVNGRGLDLRIRLAPGLDGLEPAVRDAVAKSVVRGSVTISLAVERVSGGAEIRINAPALAQVMAAVEQVRSTGDFLPPSPEGILGIRGVLEFTESVDSDEARAARDQALLASLSKALSALTASRRAEGDRLAAVIADQIAAIERITATVAASPARTPEAIRTRLAEQVRRIVATGVALDEQRLYQEAALLATKADVEEELKRLAAHTAQARDLLQAREPVGRKLDFLSQEFNREANTLCSKANDVEITRLGLELKVIIDQMREQVQNIE